MALDSGASDKVPCLETGSASLVLLMRWTGPFAPVAGGARLRYGTTECWAIRKGYLHQSPEGLGIQHRDLGTNN